MIKQINIIQKLFKVNMNKGLLVVIEGINGAGKTTIINQLINRYKSLRVPIAVYKFPNRNGIHGIRIDQYLKGQLKIESKFDVLQMFAEDRMSVQEFIKQDLEECKIVICDRYVFSAVAYHIPLHISDPKKIHMYCNVIGYFDKDMPTPHAVYLIEGDHLAKRGIVNRERFHYNGSKSHQLHNMLYKVIRTYTDHYALLKNKNGKVDQVVNYIVNDLNFRMYR